MSRTRVTHRKLGVVECSLIYTGRKVGIELSRLGEEPVEPHQLGHPGKKDVNIHLAFGGRSVASLNILTSLSFC